MHRGRVTPGPEPCPAPRGRRRCRGDRARR
jgi:hypothetical protein